MVYYLPATNKTWGFYIMVYKLLELLFRIPEEQVFK